MLNLYNIFNSIYIYLTKYKIYDDKWTIGRILRIMLPRSRRGICNMDKLQTTQLIHHTNSGDGSMQNKDYVLIQNCIMIMINMILLLMRRLKRCIACTYDTEHMAHLQSTKTSSGISAEIDWTTQKWPPGYTAPHLDE